MHVWWLFAHYHGFDPDAVALADRPINEIPQALLNHEVDAAIIWEPWTSRLRGRLGDQLQTFPNSNVYTAKWVVVTTRRTARQYARRSSRVLAAYQAAIEYVERRTGIESVCRSYRCIPVRVTQLGTNARLSLES